MNESEEFFKDYDHELFKDPSNLMTTINIFRARRSLFLLLVQDKSQRL